MLHEFLGWCTYTISETEFFVDNDKKLYNKQTWSELKNNSLIMPAESYAKIKEYILKQCKKSDDCGKDFSKWERKTTKINEKILSF